MPPTKTQKTPVKEKLPVQKLKSGVEVWYPPSLYKNAATSSPTAAPSSFSKSVATKTLEVPKRTSVIVQPPVGSVKRTRKSATVSQFQEDDSDSEQADLPKTTKKAVRFTKRATEVAKNSATSSTADTTVKLRSGVAVWYPEALYPKKPSEKDVPELLSEETAEDDEKATSKTKKYRKTVLEKPTQPLPKIPRKIITKKKTPVAYINVLHAELIDDVEMVDAVPVPTEGVDIMDVDPVETVKDLRSHSSYIPDDIPQYILPELPRVTVSSAQVTFCLVMDTNIFLTENGGRFLVALTQDRLTKLPPVQIRIPHIVFVELDKLKMRQPIAPLAIQAIRFLNDCITTREDPRFIGQTALEYKRGRDDFPHMMNDDHIIIYCNQIESQQIPNSMVMCVTNDRNLQTRATVNQVRPMSGQELYREVENCMNGIPSMFDQKAKTVPVARQCRPQNGVNLSVENCKLVEKCVRIVLLKLLTAMVESRFEQEYNNVWKDVVKIKPPWLTLESVAHLITTHWSALFFDIFNNDDKSAFTSLSTISGSKSPQRQTEEILMNGARIVAIINRLDSKERSRYELVSSQAKLLVERWRDLFDHVRRGLQTPELLIQDCEDFIRRNPSG